MTISNLAADTEIPNASIAGASSITQANHRAILQQLRKAMEEYHEATNQSRRGLEFGTEAEPAALRIRDWWIFQEEGETYLDIFLDKGLILDQSEPNGCHTNVQISLEECSAFHAFLLETDYLAPFADHLQIRIGSPGGEPTLRDVADFLPWKKCMTSIQTWTKQNSRDKYVMLLDNILVCNETLHAESFRASQPLTNAANLVLTEGKHTFLISLADVKLAVALPFHKGSLLFAPKAKKTRRKR